MMRKMTLTVAICLPFLRKLEGEPDTSLEAKGEGCGSARHK
jgi:hypothetical protein